MAHQNVQKGDEVLVMRGKFRKKQGRVIKFIREENRVLIEGINLVKRHSKPSMKMRQGGIVEKESPIHVSNVKLVTKGSKDKVEKTKAKSKTEKQKS